MKRSKKILIVFFILLLGFIFYRFLFSKNPAYEGSFSGLNKQVAFSDDGLEFEYKNIRSDTVEDFLNENQIAVGNNDHIFPPKESMIYSGTRIIMMRNKNFTVNVDKQKVEGKTLGTNIAMALWDSNVRLGEDDFSTPALDAPLKNNAKVDVVRVDIKEEIVKKEIDFEKDTTEDDELSWRTKKVSQKGVKGIDEYKYKVVSHNGKEISRKLLGKERTKDPITEISVQGTYMKLGKANKGQGTWYAWKGGLFAASTTIPKGAFVKVTNTDNGKTVVVQINDYGPQGKGRIIDLDKVAFEKIASLGAGVINVKVEQVLN